MIPYNKFMKDDKTKGLKKDAIKMSLHVGRCKTNNHFAGSNKSMFEQQLFKNCKQQKSMIIFEKCIHVQWGIQCNQMKTNEMHRNSMIFNEIH